MKTNYKILWIDDDLGSLDVDEEQIQSYLLGCGIQADFIKHELSSSDDEEILDNKLKEIERTLNTPDLDMIFVDFKMSAVRDGDALVSSFRDSKNFLPVIFYSSNREGMTKAAAAAGIEGVYFSTRNRLGDKVIQVLESLLRKEQTIKNTRGLLMDGVSEIEAMLDGVARMAWERLGEAKKDVVVKYFNGIVEDDIESAKKNKEKVPENADAFSNVFSTSEEEPKFRAMMRWKLLKKILDELGHEEEQRTVFKELNSKSDGTDPLFSLRNKYAHKTRNMLEQGHSDEQCIYIRNELRKQIANLNEIIKALS